MAKFQYTSQRAVRAAFWEAHPTASKTKIPDHSGQGSMYTTDTRTLFVDFVDALARAGDISPELADRVTL